MNQFIPSYIIAYSNSDFTNPHEVILPEEPEDRTANFTHMGVQYWGLETKRHTATKIDGHDKRIFYDHNAFQWVKIGFKNRAEISNLKVSTKWFTGNQVRAISVTLIDELNGTEKEVITQQKLAPDQDHNLNFESTTATECFVKMYYEGGISRINFFGKITKKQPSTRTNILSKAKITNVSNEHYGNPKMAVEGCRKEMHMVGWESARTGFGEQAIFHLEKPANIEEIVVDTYLHRLNPPLTCHIFGLLHDANKSFHESALLIPRWSLKFEDETIISPTNFQQYMLDQDYLNESLTNTSRFEIFLDNPSNSPWKAILPFESLSADTYHRFTEFEHEGTFSHLLYLHYPNGGIHGLKVFASEA